MKLRLYMIGLILSLLLFSACGNNQVQTHILKLDQQLDSLEERLIDHTSKENQGKAKDESLDELKARLASYEAENERLTQEVNDLRVMVRALTEGAAKGLAPQPEGNYVPYHVLDIMDRNVQILYDHVAVDPYNYMHPEIDTRLSQATSLDELMSYYTNRLDGYHAEDFSAALGDFYREMDFKDFVATLSAYETEILGSVGAYLVYNLDYHEHGIRDLEAELELHDTTQKEVGVIEAIREAVRVFKEDRGL